MLTWRNLSLGQQHCMWAHKVNPKFWVLSKVNHHNRGKKSVAKERGVCNLLLPAVRDTQKHELAHEIPQTRAISVCPPDNTEGSKKQTEKTLNLDSGNGQFKITPEIHGFDKDPYRNVLMQLSKSTWTLWVQTPPGEFCQRICHFYKPQTVLEWDFCHISVANILAQGEKKDLITDINQMCNSELSQI